MRHLTACRSTEYWTRIDVSTVFIERDLFRLEEEAEEMNNFVSFVEDRAKSNS